MTPQEIGTRTMPETRLRTGLALFVLTGFLLGGCAEDAAPPKAPAAKVEQDAVTFPADSPQVAAIIVAEAAVRGDSVYRFNGRLVWDEDRTARVVAPLAGRVQSIAVRPGDAVRAGQTLAVVSAPDLGAAQAEARKSAHELALARKALVRNEELHAAGVAPAKDLQAAQAEVGRLEAERERTASRLRLYGASEGGVVDQRFALRSPIGGTVVERHLNPGQELRAEAGERPLFVVSDPTHLWFMLDATEAEAGLLHAGSEVEIRAASAPDTAGVGRITHVADFVDPQTRTVKVRGVIDNAARRFKAEMYISGQVRQKTAAGMVVPESAVFLRGDRHFVFVAGGERRFVRRPVVIGSSQSGQQVIVDGLQKGDRVVVDGALLLQHLLALGGSR